MRDPFVCGGCGRRFRALEAFDAHRVGEFTNEGPSYGRWCSDPVPARRWRLNAHGEWGRATREGEGSAAHWRRPRQGEGGR